MIKNIKNYARRKGWFGRLLSALLALSIQACSDAGFLDNVPDASLVVPATVDDFQAVLDNERFMNGSSSYGVTPVLGEAGADDYVFRDNLIDALLNGEMRSIYTWEPLMYTQFTTVEDWNNCYRTIFYANTVLDGMAKIARGQARNHDVIVGSALFFRAYSCFQLAQVFAPPYLPATAGADLGIPLRLSSDVNEKITRPSLEATYGRIVEDLLASLPKLPATAAHNTRPSRDAGYALLARVFLTMQQYDRAGSYADSCIRYTGRSLLDYNDPALLDAPAYPFRDHRNNPEILFMSRMGINQVVLVNPGASLVADEVCATFPEHDLRRQLYLKPEHPTGFSYRGSYSGNHLPFSGLALDEVYLIRAECEARRGETGKAISDLNFLLANRWRAGFFVPYGGQLDNQQVLDLVKAERRKELLMRGLRWTDLRRYNREGAGITLQRTLRGQVYSLPANDNRYVYPIPPDVINFNPGMPQNSR